MSTPSGALTVPGPPVDLGQIQGNVLPGFASAYQMLIALRIDGPAAARGWLRDQIGHVTTARQLYAERWSERKRPAGTLLNLAFSAAGVNKLLGVDAPFGDEAFRAGLAARSALLGDPTEPDDPGHRSNWVVGSAPNDLDVLVIVAGARRATVERRSAEIMAEAEANGLTPTWHECGAQLGSPDEPAIEHFGFRDGVSQPGVRGFDPATGRPLTRQRIKIGPRSDGPDFAAPGVPLIWPGSFVFGYPAQDPIDARAPGPVAGAGPTWTRNGSYLVFRRLRQDVGGLVDFIETEAARLGWEPDMLAALLVGRWKSGAPVVRTSRPGEPPPGKEDPPLGLDRNASNHFDFTSELAEPVLLDRGDGGPLARRPPALPDPLGLICPNSAHIRKVNPRSGYTEQGGLEDTLARRILRRGMPYGPRLVDPEDEQARELDRGLHFLCYQTSVVRQFEFITRGWMNSPTGPRGGGHDLIVGQASGVRSAFLPIDGGEPVEIRTDARFVIPTGGGYLFAPSISGLERLAGTA